MVLSLQLIMIFQVFTTGSYYRIFRKIRDSRDRRLISKRNHKIRVDDQLWEACLGLLLY